MAEFRESVGENTEQRALMDVLNRIQERGQPQFTNPLKVKYYQESLEMMRMPGHQSFFYIAEVLGKYWPWRRHRKLFAIIPGFYGGAHGKKEISCILFDRSLLGIVKEEMQKYADASQATAVNLTHDFVR